MIRPTADLSERALRSYFSDHVADLRCKLKMMMQHHVQTVREDHPDLEDLRRRQWSDIERIATKIVTLEEMRNTCF